MLEYKGKIQTTAEQKVVTENRNKKS